jgi:hypothetical protein
VHALIGQDTTMASSWCCRPGFQELLAVPCGQVARRASKSMANAALSYRHTPLEYSIARLICAVSCGLGVVMVG